MANDPNLERAAELFEEALRLDGPAREAFLAEACGGCRPLRKLLDKLLAANTRQGDFLAHPTGAAEAGAASAAGAAQIGGGAPPTPTTRATSRHEQEGAVIGRYKLLQQIGEGGFGVVFMAEQREPVQRRVALKIIKLGMDTRQVVARFEAERQALAMMEHPNIAKVLDAGATESGRPFFVMELVRGDPITEYCDRNSLSTRERLELFRQVCHAVQHAHQKGVIHRDLKPTNVLVTIFDGKPIPKIIDFGIAKATSARLTEKTLFTEHRQLIGTPAYMSPEQAEMSGVDIDTRSDVYSLGVLLYELLTGTTPFDANELRAAAFAEIQRIIREEEPPKPSTRLSTLKETLRSVAAHRRTEPGKLGALIRGDLDWIVMCCLEKDRTRRYETANGLAMDIDRHLAGEPVIAAPPSRTYRVRKFVRRNRNMVAAVLLVAVLLVLGLVGTSWGVFWAVGERNRAREAGVREREQREVAEAVTRFVNDALAMGDPRGGVGNPGLTMREALAEASRSIDDGALRTQPSVEAGVRTTLARAYVGVGDWRAAQTNIARALGLLEPGGDSLGLAAARVVEADLCQARGLFRDMERAGREVVRIRRKLLPHDDKDVAQAINDLGYALCALAQFEEADALLAEAMAINTRLFGELGAEVAETFHNQAISLTYRERYAEAEKLARRALEIRRQALPPDHPKIEESLASVAQALLDQERHEEAGPFIEEELAMARRRYGDSHHHVAFAMGRLQSVQYLRGDVVEAERTSRAALEMIQRTLGGEHPLVAAHLTDLGGLLSESGRADEAIPLHREALAILQKSPISDERKISVTMSALAYALSNANQFEEAESLAQDAAARMRRAVGDRHPDLAYSLRTLGMVLMRSGRLEEAELVVREGVEIANSVLGPRSPRAVNGLWTLAGVLERERRFDEAIAMLIRARDIYREANPTGVAWCSNDLARILVQLRRPAEAEPYAREALELNLRARGAGSPAALWGAVVLARTLQDQGKLPEAEPVLREAITAARPSLPPGNLELGKALSSLGQVLMGLGRIVEAEAAFREAVAVHRQRPGTTSAEEGETLGRLSQALFAQSRPVEAEAPAREAVEILGRVHPPDPPNLSNVRLQLADCLAAQGRHEDAEPFYREVLDTYPMYFAGYPLEVANTRIMAAVNLLELQKYEEARVQLELGSATRDALLPPGNWQRASAWSLLGEALTGLGRYPEAERLLIDGAQCLEAAVRESDADLPPIVRDERLPEAIERVIHLYDVWHAAAPNDGHERKAASWREKLKTARARPQ